MKKLIFIQIFLFSIGSIGCGDATNTASTTVNRTNTATTPLKTPLSNQMNQLNKATDSAENRDAISTSANRMNNSVATNGNTRTSNTNVAGTPMATPAPKVEKKDEGLFSFPPPKVISYTLINNSDLLNKEGQTTFLQISEKLAAGLNKAGYSTDDKFSYFWNEKDEFAVITAMERVTPDGSPVSGVERWNNSTHLPKANNWGEYIRYLTSGKKVYYRVFAFVVTSKRTGRSFYRNSPPDFIMARNWMNKGESALGDGESSAVEDSVFTEKYKCFALLYLFVNHTRLDSPKSIDTLTENDEGLKEGVNQEAADHLRNTQIKFGD